MTELVHDEVAVPMPPESPNAQPKQWELRAAWRAFARSRDTGTRRNPAQQMVDAAWSLVAEADDFTVKQVAERANVALQTFYRHFGSKDELLLAMMEEQIGRGSAMYAAEASQEPDPRERLRTLIFRAIVGPRSPDGVRRIQWSARERQRLSQRYPLEVEAVHEPYREAILGVIEDARSAGLANVDDPKLTANVIQHLVLALTHLVAGGAIESSPEEVADAVLDLCWRGLSRRDDEPE
jgi:TetR/AcrR family transcriptional regulator